MRERAHTVGLIGAGIDASLSPALHEARGRRARARATRTGCSTSSGRRARRRPARAGARRRVQRRERHAPVQAGRGRATSTSSPPRPPRSRPSTPSCSTTAARSATTPTRAGSRRASARGLPGRARSTRSCCSAPAAPGAAVAHAALRLGARRARDRRRRRRRAPRRSRTGSDARHRRRSTSSLDADGLIHATPDRHGRPPRAAAARGRCCAPDLWVAEVVYRPLETELLKRARELGCRTLDGGGMAVFQAAGSFELFTGVTPDRERMLRHFAELIATGRRRDEALDRHRLPERHARREARRGGAPPASTASSCSRPT